MRRVSQLGVVLVLLTVTTAALAVPASADRTDREHTHPHASGGSGSDAIWVSVGASGSAKRSYPSCPWQRGWPTGSGATEVRGVPSLFGGFASGLFSWISNLFGGGPDPATIELVPLTEADLDGDGEVDEDFIVPVLGDDEYVIGETEGLSWVNDFVIRIAGTHDLGVFIDNPDGDADPDTLTDDELAGSGYRESSSFPLIQRGTDPSTGQDLWWDPWFVAPEDQTSSCNAGVIYSPRLNNPTILLPDLQAFVSDLLPPVEPALLPVDRDEGWAYVQVPTNFAVTAGSLTRQSAHAEVQYIDAAGNSSALWADIEAIPTHLAFDPGDGSDPVVCHLSQMGFTPADPGDCSHVFLDSSNVSPGNVFTTTVSVLWVGLYNDSLGVSSVVDIVPTVATFDIAVAEARPAVSIEE